MDDHKWVRKQCNKKCDIKFQGIPQVDYWHVICMEKCANRLKRHAFQSPFVLVQDRSQSRGSQQ